MYIGGSCYRRQKTHIANAVDGGVTRINAGNNVNLSTVNTSSDNRITWDAKNHLFFGGSQEVGTQINTEGTTVIHAGNDTALLMYWTMDIPISLMEQGESILTKARCH